MPSEYSSLRYVSGIGRLLLIPPNQAEDGSERKLTIYEIRTNKDRLRDRKYPPYKMDEEYIYYTRSETMIESDFPPIVEIADRFKKVSDSPYQIAKMAYDYVVENLTYTSPSPTWTAKQCQLEKKGACGQFSALFAAICRAAGVPARPVIGTWAEGENQWHCWAEFMLPEVGWIPADPTVGQRGPREREYYFGNLDNNHQPHLKCVNMKFHTQLGHPEAGFSQVGEWRWYPAAGSTGNNMSVEFLKIGRKL
jgi:transglutaminase-like putative cysteine protease